MRHLVIPPGSFLNQLRATFPSSTSRNPWYVVAAVGFSASNQPDAVAQVFSHAVESVPEHKERLLIARRIRDSLFKSGLITGFPKAINALLKLKEVTPSDLLDTEPQRNIESTLANYESTGDAMFRRFYGENASSTEQLLNEAYPDLGVFSKTIGYGFVYGFQNYINDVETSYVLIASLVALDTPLQIRWHLDSARRNGATIEEVRAVRSMAIEIAKFAGVIGKEEIPDL